MQKFGKNQKGFAALFITFLVMAIVFGIAVSIFIVTHNEQEIIRNIVKSNQAYYAAESGIEDILLRLTDGKDWSPSYILDVGGASAAVAISDILGGARTVLSEGNDSNRLRKIQIVYRVVTEKASFYYGAQIGDGGLVMKNGSEVQGNIFSNGNVTGAGDITDTVIVAGNGNMIDGLTVGKDAHVYNCKDSSIIGTLTYVSGGTIDNCTAEEIVDGGPEEIAQRDFPVTQEMIDSWKSEAESGGIISGDLVVDEDMSLGPVKIEGNLFLDDAVLTMTGTIWTQGTFDTANNAEAVLDEDSYGNLSGVLMADGTIEIRNNVSLKGTSSPSSYLLVISNSPSLLEDTPAINVRNNALGSILFTPNGLMLINNNVELTEATAYKLILENNTQITYEIGLENLEFTSGPGGSWTVTDWEEIQ